MHDPQTHRDTRTARALVRWTITERDTEMEAEEEAPLGTGKIMSLDWSKCKHVSMTHCCEAKSLEVGWNFERPLTDDFLR